MGMSDVAAYTMTVKCMNYCYGGSPALEVDEYPDEFCVVKYADHLAALERVRGETLREVRSAVYRYVEMNTRSGSVGESVGSGCIGVIQILIDATTTGDTDA